MPLSDVHATPPAWPQERAAGFEWIARVSYKTGVLSLGLWKATLVARIAQNFRSQDALVDTLMSEENLFKFIGGAFNVLILFEAALN